MTTAAPSLTRFAWLSITAAICTILLKGAAYFLTGSVGLLSDAMESFVNLAGGIVALLMLTWAEQPPDEEHAYGHGKAEYFSSGVEGGLIMIAALCIGWTSVVRLIWPRAIEQAGIGLAISTVGSLINYVVAVVLMRAGKKNHSITLEADAKHLFTDVWTSFGVLVGVGLVALTGIQRLDPIVAMLVAVNIVWQGVSLVKRSALGLMDTALPPDESSRVRAALEKYAATGVQFHALRTRQAGARRFVSFHVLVPGKWTVAAGHDLLEKIEAEVRGSIPNATVDTHLEPIDDPVSFHDQKLDRTPEP